MEFTITSDYKPDGDQPRAIKELTRGYDKYPAQTLLGVTGSGKTFTIANLIQNVQKPTLVLAHNKTLAGQLYSEFKDFFPDNKVCYFISYYDYYQPESYLPSTDTYIEKETMINEKIDQMRMEAIAALVTRPDVIVVASVSCIYSLGSPIDFRKSVLRFTVGMRITRNDFTKQLVDLLYQRNDMDLAPARFRVRGDTIDIIQAFGGDAYRFEFFGDEIEAISICDLVTFDVREEVQEINIYPAKPFIAPEEKRKDAIASIREELREQLPKLGLLEAHRLEQRTQYDLEMIEQIGYCKGVENYSRHFDGRKPGEQAYCLIDFFEHNPFSKDFLMVIDESHVSVPQVRGMYFGDYSRKKNLVDFGFRLPSAFDNRPLKFAEFEKYMKHTVFVSATPGQYEADNGKQIVEQIVRPTGLIDPPIFIRPITGQMEDLKNEIYAVLERKERVLVTTLTKRSAEELAEYLVHQDIRARYLHSEIDTLDRAQLIKELRLGYFDVIVGINLLREGLDIPEVSLVAILDADKEGFLRNATSLIQTIGRAARNVHAKVIMYADRETDSMKAAIRETDRRRIIQLAYNKKHGITPTTIIKKLNEDIVPSDELVYTGELFPKKISELEAEMQEAVERLDFEKAITLREKIKNLQEKHVEETKKKKKRAKK